MESIGVFLSSTSRDLQDERKAVEAIVRRMKIPFVGMEYFGSDHRAPIDVCIQNLRECSIYIGVVGFRYGSEVPNSTMSFTELEYHEATKAGLPRLIYLKSKEAKVRVDSVDSDPKNRERLERFRSLIEANHVVSYFIDEKELASMVAADLHRLLVNRSDRIKIVEETDLLQVPRVMIKRAEMALLHASQIFDSMQSLEKKNELTREKAQEKALESLRSYHFRFDGQFTVFDSNRTTVFHDYEHMIGRPFRFIDVNFGPIFEALLAERNGGTLKWIDQLSSDYLIVSDVFYAKSDHKEWIRFNIAPVSYFGPWDSVYACRSSS